MKIIKSSIFLFLILLIFSCSNADDKKKATPVKKKKGNIENVKAAVSDKPKTKEAQDVQQDPLPPQQIAKAKEILSAVSDADVEKVDGKKKFKLFCATCHGFKGDMMVNGAKDLTKSTIPLENAVAQVYHGKGLMTPYKGVLKEHEIVAVCKYIETLRK